MKNLRFLFLIGTYLNYFSFSIGWQLFVALLMIFYLDLSFEHSEKLINLNG